MKLSSCCSLFRYEPCIITSREIIVRTQDGNYFVLITTTKYCVYGRRSSLKQPEHVLLGGFKSLLLRVTVKVLGELKTPQPPPKKSCTLCERLLQNKEGASPSLLLVFRQFQVPFCSRSFSVLESGLLFSCACADTETSFHRLVNSFALRGDRGRPLYCLKRHRHLRDFYIKEPASCLPMHVDLACSCMYLP